MSDESIAESEGAGMVPDGERGQRREISSRWVRVVGKKQIVVGGDLECL